MCEFGSRDLNHFVSLPMKRHVREMSYDVGAHYSADQVVKNSASSTVCAKIQQGLVSANRHPMERKLRTKIQLCFSMLFQWTVCEFPIRQIPVVMASGKPCGMVHLLSISPFVDSVLTDIPKLLTLLKRG